MIPVGSHSRQRISPHNAFIPHNEIMRPSWASCINTRTNPIKTQCAGAECSLELVTDRFLLQVTVHTGINLVSLIGFRSNPCKHDNSVTVSLLHSYSRNLVLRVPFSAKLISQSKKVTDEKVLFFFFIIILSCIPFDFVNKRTRLRLGL